jgi:hypothetical protein
MSDPTPIDFICQRWREAKLAEETACNERLAAEEELIALVGFKEEGTTTVKTDWFTVKTVGKLNRSLIPESLGELQNRIPHAVYDQVIRYKPELSLSGLHAVERANPEIYRLFTGAIVTRPAKTSVSIELRVK